MWLWTNGLKHQFVLWGFLNSFGDFVILIKISLSPSFSRSPGVAHTCPCQRCERRWKQPTVTMCSCISNFLWRIEKWEGRKRKVLRKRSEKDRWSEKEGRAKKKKRRNWTVMSCACVSLPAPYTCSSLFDNINFRQHLFGGRQCSCQVVPRCSQRVSLWIVSILFLPGRRWLIMHIITEMDFFFWSGACRMQNGHVTGAVVFNFMHNHTCCTQALMPPAYYTALTSQWFTNWELSILFNYNTAQISAELPEAFCVV